MIPGYNGSASVARSPQETEAATGGNIVRYCAPVTLNTVAYTTEIKRSVDSTNCKAFRSIRRLKENLCEFRPILQRITTF